MSAIKAQAPMLRRQMEVEDRQFALESAAAQQALGINASDQAMQEAGFAMDVANNAYAKRTAGRAASAEQRAKWGAVLDGILIGDVNNKGAGRETTAGAALRRAIRLGVPAAYAKRIINQHFTAIRADATKTATDIFRNPLGL
jgi:hypothetical protein